jgi:hypothetical protein
MTLKFKINPIREYLGLIFYLIKPLAGLFILGISPYAKTVCSSMVSVDTLPVSYDTKPLIAVFHICIY